MVNDSSESMHIYVTLVLPPVIITTPTMDEKLRSKCEIVVGVTCPANGEGTCKPILGPSLRYLEICFGKPSRSPPSHVLKPVLGAQ